MFQDFDLRLDVLARYRSNGGVYVMTEFQPQGFPGKGFEIQVNNSHSDRIRTGSLYHVVDLSNVPGKDDEWIPMEIKGQGNTITISVKGQEVVRWTQPADWQSNYDTRQPQDRTRHLRVPVARPVQRDRVREHSGQGDEVAGLERVRGRHVSVLPQERCMRRTAAGSSTGSPLYADRLTASEASGSPIQPSQFSIACYNYRLPT